MTLWWPPAYFSIPFLKAGGHRHAASVTVFLKHSCEHTALLLSALQKYFCTLGLALKDLLAVAVNSLSCSSTANASALWPSRAAIMAAHLWFRFTAPLPWCALSQQCSPHLSVFPKPTHKCLDLTQMPLPSLKTHNPLSVPLTALLFFPSFSLWTYCPRSILEAKWERSQYFFLTSLLQGRYRLAMSFNQKTEALVRQPSSIHPSLSLGSGNPSLPLSPSTL